MNFTLFNILSIVILFQLVLLILFLFTSKKGKKVSNQILGFFFLVLAVNIGDGVLSIAGFFEKFPQWAHVEDGFILLLGPLLYFYTCSVIYRNFSFRRKDVFHLLPFVLITVSLLSFYHSQSAEKKQLIESAVVRRDLPPAFYIIAALVYVHVLIYLVAAFQKVLSYRDEIRQKFSSIEKINLDWLIFLLLSITLILLGSWVNVMIPVTGARDWFDYSLLIIIIILFLFINVVVFKGLRQPEIFAGLNVEPVAPTRDPSFVASETIFIQNKLKGLVSDQKLFLDPELSLDILAEKTGISSRKLSQFINATYKKNFFDFVNSFRIEEAMRILRESQDPGLTVLEAMYQSGFNSKSSFNTLFKKATGMTPSAYRRQYRSS